MTTLANKYRPRRFTEVIGQEDQVAVMLKIMEKGWRPPAILLTGPFGTGKTTLARLIARALLCDHRQEQEPCGECDSCVAMDGDNHPGYTEVDAASQGLVADVRGMKDFISYRTSGDKMQILCYDESHMLSQQAQNALLQTLEEGQRGVMFLFCTTEPNKMLPTIRSRCVELTMRLLTAGQITQRLLAVAAQEGIRVEEKAARVIGTYVRGHVRDGIVLLEQLSQMADSISDELVRSYLRLDQDDELYKFLTETDKRKALELLEVLLCTFSVNDLQERVGQILVNAYKLKQGLDGFTQVDRGWLQRVLEVRGDRVLDEAEAILSLRMDFPTINLGVASFSKVLLEEEICHQNKGSVRGLRPGATEMAPTVQVMRKPGTEAVGSPVQAYKAPNAT